MNNFVQPYAVRTTIVPLFIDHMNSMIREYGLCTRKIAPRTERQSWGKCDLTKRISRKNKENMETLIQHS